MKTTINERDFLSFLLTKQRLSQGTIVTRKSRFRIFNTWLLKTNQELTNQTIESFFYYLQTEKKLKNTSLNTYLITLLSLRNYVIDRGIGTDFMNGFKRFTEEDPFKEPLVKEEIDALLKVELSGKMEKVYKDLTLFFAHTATRWEDARDIRCKNIDLLTHKISYIQKKTGSLRIVYINEPLVSVLKKRITKNPNDLIFPNMNGNQIHYPDFHYNIKKRAEKAGITKCVSPHIFRHSYGQALYDDTGDIYLVKDSLGHKNIRSTEHYAKNSQARIKNAELKHVFIRKSLDPKQLIQELEEKVNSFKLQEDERFDYIKVKKIINSFITDLYQAITI